MPTLFKDAALDMLAGKGNVAQFVSFGPQLDQRFSRIREELPNAVFGSTASAVEALLRRSPESSVNVRSYHPEHPKSREFKYGLKVVDEVVSALARFASAGLFTIVNETVDIHDGGVSGVVAGDVIEFAPDATPRCVEEPGTAALPRGLGLQLLRTVYGFSSDLDYLPEMRVEFSVHPKRRGVRGSHTLVWEIESLRHQPAAPEITWPNRFSQSLGDKVYGLLVADALGVPVPRTLVIPRRLAPFHFGVETETGETWIRTSPADQTPGFFTTEFGWRDPFTLLAQEDPDARVASVLAQQAVDAKYSGAFAAAEDEPLGWLIEGVRGPGDGFMLGSQAPDQLPAEVAAAVRKRADQIRTLLGDVRGEWVFDGRECWIVQLHRARALVSRREIYPGNPTTFRSFPVEGGLDALRVLIDEVKGRDTGIVVVGRVGVTSHFGDVLRQAEVPSFIQDAAGGA